MLVLVAAGLTAALVAAADPASREAVTRLALRDAFYVGVALWLGVRAGLVAIRPAGALRRSVRALTLVCAAVLLGRLADVPLPQAGVVVTAVVLAGVLFIALARLDDVMAVVDRRHGVTGWTWFLGVMTVTVVLLTAAGILAAVAGAGPLDWVFSAVAQAVGIVWSAVVFILYLIGYGVMRAIAWLASLVHLSVPQAIKEQDAPELKVQPLKLPEREGGGGSSLLRDLFIVVFAALAAGALVLALVGALRRVRTGERDDQVVEERESLASGADLLRGMGARIARLVPRRVRRRARRRPPRRCGWSTSCSNQRWPVPAGPGLPRRPRASTWPPRARTCRTRRRRSPRPTTSRATRSTVWRGRTSRPSRRRARASSRPRRRSRRRRSWAPGAACAMRRARPVPRRVRPAPRRVRPA